MSADRCDVSRVDREIARRRRARWREVALLLIAFGAIVLYSVLDSDRSTREIRPEAAAAQGSKASAP